MGSGIAQVAASAGHPVWLYDNNPTALERARTQLVLTMEKLVTKGKITTEAAQQTIGRITFTTDKFTFSGKDLIIEAIVERLDAKRALFEEMEEIAGQQAILATNTSSLAVTAIAAACKSPQRVVGVHFFNPAPLMALVEVVPAVQTDPAVVDTCLQWMRDWGKTPVLAKDTPGFIVNRVARPFYGEALRILEEGMADIATIDWAMTHLGGFRMGPFALMDYIGHDINYKVTETVFAAFYYDGRYKPSFTQQRLVDAGYLGRKSGRGFYDYAPGAQLPQPTEDAALGRRILHRILVMLINEAADALHQRVASREDLELAMTQGVNYPKGLLAWADELTIPYVVEQLDALHRTYLEERYRCSPLLRQMMAAGQRFFRE